MNNDKLLKAIEAADIINAAAHKIQKALDILEANGLNLENYPESWSDFAEHPGELRNMFVSDFTPGSDIQVMVGEKR